MIILKENNKFRYRLTGYQLQEHFYEYWFSNMGTENLIM